MAGKGYTTIAIPDELADEVDKIVEKGELGYKSRSE